MSNDRNIYLITRKFNTVNGWTLYTGQIQDLLSSFGHVVRMDLPVEEVINKKKSLYRILFQLLLLPSLWIEPLLSRRKLVDQLTDLKNPDIIVLDHFQFWWMIFGLKQKYPRSQIILVSHNLEFRNKYTYIKYAPFVYKIFALLELPILFFWEYLCSKKSDHITSINSYEQKFFAGTLINKPTALIYPKFIEISNDSNNEHSKSDIRDIILVGSYGYVAKKLNAIWIADLFNELSSNLKFRLNIIGRDAPDSMIKVIKKLKNVEFVGEVEDLGKWYDCAHAVVIPERIGGGFKLKILEAIGFGKPMIIHEEALIGTGFKSEKECLSFTDGISLESSLMKISENDKFRRDLIKNAKKNAESNFRHEANYSNLKSILTTDES